MEMKDLIKRYIKREDYFYRLRKKENNEELLVYYYGVKMFDINNLEITPNIKFFLPNSKNDKTGILGKNIVLDYNNMKIGNKKIKIKCDNKDYDDYKAVYLKMKSLEKNKKQNVRFVSSSIKDLSFSEIENMEQILERRIKLYSNNLEEYSNDDFLPTTSKDGKREKIYQLQIMNFLNIDSKKNEIVKNKNDVFKIRTFPLEMEYELKTSNKKKKFNGIYIPDGRIDNIFIQDNIVNMVEIKIGTPVIDGFNGIHKHLLDLAYCIEKGIIDVEDFEKIITGRNYILKKYKLNSFSNISENVDKLEYNVLCGYSNENERVEVYNKITKIFYLNVEQVFKLTKSGRKSKSNKINDKVKSMIKKYGKKFIDMDIPSFLSYLTDKLGCKTNIYMVNHDLTKIENIGIIKL